MRMLSEEEIVERMIEYITGLPQGSTFSTELLLKKISIAEEELLPVGDLSGIHNLLVHHLSSGNSPVKIRRCDNSYERYFLPYKQTFTR